MNEHLPDAVIRPGQDGIFLNVHTQPGARYCELRGLHGDAVKIAVQAAAQKGKANDALIRFIAEALHVSRHQVSLNSGQHSRRKSIFIAGDAGEITARLRVWLNHV